MREVLDALNEEVRAGRRAVLATVVRTTGSTPRPRGAKMLFRADGSSVGTIGGGAFEAEVEREAREMLAGKGDTTSFRAHSFTEVGDHALGMACGGSADVFLEVLGVTERLVIFGAGHVGLALARLAVTVGFEPEVVDDREAACEAARNAGVARVYRCDGDYREGVPAIDETCYVAVITRCHDTDRLALRNVLDVKTRYLGVIGSRRKRATMFRVLEDDGVRRERLDEIRCPIGIPLGGDTPAEIAVSIVAELLQVRHRAVSVPADG